MKRVDLTGQTFGRWTVVRKAPRTYATMWECRCACGNARVVSGANLSTGASLSCGCLRDELRPTYASRQDRTGKNNPRAKRALRLHGEHYMPSNDPWYKRASGIWYAAKKNEVPLGFASAHELASYAKGMAPATCPVFGVPFEERGVGFSKWSPSIDKVRPELGYVPGNIQIISMLANCMKRDASPEELRLFALWVLEK